jgi:hypothetical protein
METIMTQPNTDHSINGLDKRQYLKVVNPVKSGNQPDMTGEGSWTLEIMEL